MVSWDGSLAIGCAKFDSQHEGIFSLIDKFQLCIVEDCSPDRVRNILFELCICACDHFFEEELFMRSVGYVGVEDHIGCHDKFLEKVSEVRSKITNNSIVLRLELLEFVLSWLTGHIDIVDKMFFDCQRSRTEEE